MRTKIALCLVTCLCVVASGCSDAQYHLQGRLSERSYYTFLTTLVEKRMPPGPEADSDEQFIEAAIDRFTNERLVAYILPDLEGLPHTPLSALDTAAVAVMDSGGSTYVTSRLVSSIGSLMLHVALLKNPKAPDDMTAKYAGRLLDEHSVDFRLLLQALQRLDDISYPGVQDLAKRAMYQYAAYRRALSRIKRDMRPTVTLLGISKVLETDFTPEYARIASGRKPDSQSHQELPPEAGNLKVSRNQQLSD